MLSLPVSPPERPVRLVSVSRRTDVPAFFADWFSNSLERGFCSVRNPFNRSQTSRIGLSREEVAGFIFWTRNPEPFRETLEKVLEKGFPVVFLITLTGYPPELEPMVPPVDVAIEGIAALSERIGPERIAWRYDPLLFAGPIDFSWHLSNFAGLARRLEGRVGRCIVSLMDFYRKTRRNLAPLQNLGWTFRSDPQGHPGFVPFLERMVRTARGHGMEIQSCCSTSAGFQTAGIAPGACIDALWLNDLYRLGIPDRKDPGQRSACRCAPSKDIGACDSCRHGCRYCYATADHARSLTRIHDPEGEFL